MLPVSDVEEELKVAISFQTLLCRVGALGECFISILDHEEIVKPAQKLIV